MNNDLAKELKQIINDLKKDIIKKEELLDNLMDEYIKLSGEEED